MNKYNAKKTDKYGRKWDSLKELREYEGLLLLQRAGKITAIELQPKFTLQEAFRYNGRLERAITYKADFMVHYSDGTKEVIECKGFRTRDYLLRRKMLLFQNPNIKFTEK